MSAVATPVAPRRVMVRRARLEDVDGVYEIASSVGNGRKNPNTGFLMCDYTLDPALQKRNLQADCRGVSHFYVAEANGRICGFLIGYLREKWMRECPDWLRQVIWRPGFFVDETGDFFVLDRTAVHPGFAGRGVGKALHQQMLAELARDGVAHIFSESVIGPVPNLASMAFKWRIGFVVAGVRYESYRDVIHTNAVYYKRNPLAVSVRVTPQGVG